MSGKKETLNNAFNKLSHGRVEKKREMILGGRTGQDVGSGVNALGGCGREGKEEQGGRKDGSEVILSPSIPPSLGSAS